METQDRRKNSSSGNGVHVCTQCGWLFPNQHPSAKQRRSHKKVCGTIEVKSGNSEDYKTQLGASNNDSKTFISETKEKVEEEAFISRSISGFGSGSNRSNRSEDDVFSDAVTDFPGSISDEQINSFEDSSQEVELGELGKFSIISEALIQESKFSEVKEAGKTDVLANDEGKVNAEEQNPLVFAEVVSVEKENFSNMSMAEPSEKSVKNSEDIITETLHRESSFAGEVSVEKEMEKTHSRDTVFKEKNPLVNADTNAESALMNDGENYSHSVSSYNEDAEIFYAVKADNFKEAEEDLPLTNETSSVSDICATVEKNLLREEGNEDDHNVRSMLIEKLSESTPNLPEFEDQTHDNCFDVKIKKLQDSEEAVKDLGSPSELTIVGESANVGAENNVAEKKHDLESCVHKASDSADVSLAEKVKGNGAQLEKIDFSSVMELENVSDEVNMAEKTHKSADISLTEKVKDNDARLEKIEVSGVKDSISSEDCFGKVDLSLISDSEDVSEITQDAVIGLNAGARGETISSIVERVTKERKVTVTDKLEGSCGSVSVLSTLSDAPGATETGSLPSQESFKPEKSILKPKSNNGKSIQPESSISLIEQKATDKTDQIKALHKAEESSGKTSSAEITAELTNWSTGNQHTPLKSYLGESSPDSKENPPLMSQEMINNAVMAAKEQVDNEARVDLSEEWNSPARYQSKIKREKSKAKRPYWAPFICCSSVQTS